ncbi:hypothetical protein [Pseudomonas aeruginosa]
MTKANECTCPSGDGSLRHPCPAHPAAEQAGGDERAAFEYWASDEGLYPKAVERAGNCYKLAQTQSYWMAWQARAALAQPSLMPPDRGPWHAVKWDGGRRVDLSSDDFEHDVALTVSGDFVEGDKFRYAQELAAWMNAHLAQPSPVQAEQHWPKLEKPAQVGGVRFSAGVSSRLVVEAAQRLYEFESTPEQEAERIERLQAFREQCFEPLGTEFSKVLSDNLPELLSTAQAEQAEAERPEVVAWRYGFSGGIVSDKACLDEWKSGGEYQSLMTVAQHERIAGALRAKADQLREALEWRKENQAGQRELLRSVTAERDAALARVAELEKQEPVAHLRASDLERLNQPGIAGSAGSLWNGPREGFVPLYAAPVAQAQHSVPGDIMRDAQRYRWLRDQQFYFSFSTENSDAGISSCTAGMSSRFKNLSWVDAAIDSAIAAAPGKEVGHE